MLIVCQLAKIDDFCKNMKRNRTLLNIKHILSNMHCLQAVSTTCNRKNYESCKNRNETRIFDECTQQCIRPCERITVTTKDSTQWSDVGTEMTLQLDSMNMKIFEEKLAWGFDALLGEIGGIVGFFLGCSIYDILLLIFQLLVKLIACLMKRTDKIFPKKSKIVTIEVRPVSNTFFDGVEQSADNSKDFSTPTDFVSKLKQIGWKVNSIQWMTERIFKLIMIVYFGYLTVKMSIPFILDFSEGKTVFKIDLVLNEPLYLRNATACITLDRKEFDDPSTTNYEAEIQKYFNQSKRTKQGFLGSVNWPNILRFIIHYYLTTFSNIEMVAGEIQNDLISRASNDPSLPRFFESNFDRYKARILLERNMNLLNISVNELRQKFGREVSNKSSAFII